MAETAALLVDEVLPRQPVRQWVLSLPFALRYLLATRPEIVTQVLGIVYRAISGHLIRKAGLTRASGVTGAVTLIQRFGSALNLNVHFHMLVLDGVYRREGGGQLRFVPVPAPAPAELKGLVQRIAERIGRSLERSGLITRDIENAYLAFDPGEEVPINALLGASITYRIATGLREGQKVFTLQTLPAEPEAPRREVAESSGFSLHAGIAAKASLRDKLEHLARYVARPPVATERLSLTESGQVRCALKTPYRDGTTHVIFEPEDFMARLAALVPKPRAHLTRYHGVFAPASPDRARVVPKARAAAEKSDERGEASATDRQRALTWAQRLKRVFAIDIEFCRRCGGRLRVIASIEDPAVIERILKHLGGGDGESADPAHPSRAPPARSIALTAAMPLHRPGHRVETGRRVGLGRHHAPSASLSISSLGRQIPDRFTRANDCGQVDSAWMAASIGDHPPGSNPPRESPRVTSGRLYALSASSTPASRPSSRRRFNATCGARTR
jgi:hypothetical protein